MSFRGWDSRAGHYQNAFQSGRNAPSAAVSSQNAFSGRGHENSPWPSQSSAGPSRAATRSQLPRVNAFAGVQAVRSAQTGIRNAFGGPDTSNAFTRSGQPPNVCGAAVQLAVTAAENGLTSPGQMARFQNACLVPLCVTDPTRRNAFSMLGPASQPQGSDSSPMDQGSLIVSPGQGRLPVGPPHQSIVSIANLAWSAGPAAVQTMNAFSGAFPGAVAPTAPQPFGASLRPSVGSSMSMQTSNSFSQKANGGTPHSNGHSGFQASQQPLPALHAPVVYSASAMAGSGSEVRTETNGHGSGTQEERLLWAAPAFAKGRIPESAPPPEVCF